MKDAVRAKRWTWNVILGGSRNDTFENFQVALRSNPDSINILLVDSEAPVAVFGKAWQHLATRDNWQDPGVGDDCCHLMAQTVEVWLIVDPDALSEYYGQGFRQKALPGNSNVEEVSKQDLQRTLDRACANTKKGRYHKIHHCAALLKMVDVTKVRQRAPHCDRLFNTIIDLIS